MHFVDVKLLYCLVMISFLTQCVHNLLFNSLYVGKCICFLFAYLSSYVCSLMHSGINATIN